VLSVVALDLLAAAMASAVAFSLAHTLSPLDDPGPALPLVLPLLWVIAIGIAGGYEGKFFGLGPEEFRRVALGCLGLTALIGTASWALDADVGRGYVALAMPVAAVLTVLGRYGFRKYVHQMRKRGEFQHRTVVVGEPDAVERLAATLGRGSYHGYQVLGACLPAGYEPVPISTVPLVGSLDTVVAAVVALRADTVAVVAGTSVDEHRLRRLAWELEPTGANLVVAPALVEVAGPRMSVRPVEGLPLLHVDQPAFTGFRRLVKGVYDPVVAACAVVLLAPLLLGIAIAIKVDSPGPVFFRQTRVGQRGREFKITKFRTMVADADRRKADLMHLNEGSGPLFKLREDPRVTRVGSFLRRTSLDELPQLFDVLVGHMSLVGPRPHLASELALFGDDSVRRLMVKPGMTGLWQISGRSDLTFEESVRVDLRYVENWSLTLDLFILWKTVSVILQRDGAY
jgi:exopolysaccharide biosynthesis polyprenyl glycosylphosphotransferase